MPEDNSLDLTGIGKAANAIPPEAWKEMAVVASETVRDIVAPLTAGTTGAARLVQGYFDRLVDVQKIKSAALLRKAREKVEASGKAVVQEVQPRVIIPMLENAGLQDDPVLSELWSNLLAQEFTGGAVHPEFAHILARLTAEDAHALADVDKNKGQTILRAAMNRALATYRVDQANVPRAFYRRANKPNQSQAILMGMNLISKGEGGWYLTALGDAFIEAVTDPSNPASKGAAAQPNDP